jgi:ATP adenylyltransferase
MKKAKSKSKAKVRAKNKAVSRKISSQNSSSSDISKASADWTAKLVKSVWPQERDFFERPDRYRYVRKLLPKSDCVFCEASVKGENSDSLILKQDDYSIVIMNKYPYNTGHLLVLPREHKANIWDLNDATLASIAVWQKRCVQVLRTVFDCQGFNLGMNHGAVAGAGIPNHLHWHIVPRWGGDTNFFPLIAETKVLPETLETTYSRLEAHFQGFSKEDEA